MMNIHSTQPHVSSRQQNAIRALHRYGGVTAALLILIICTTGILLNHGDALGLDKTRVRANWLLNWYGITAPALQSYAADGLFVTQAGRRLYIGAVSLDGNYTRLHGAVTVDDLVLVGADESLLLLQPDGTLVEKLATVHGLPAGIKRIGMSNNMVVVETNTGLWQADATLSKWQGPVENTDAIDWSYAARLPDKLHTAVLADLRGAGLPLERVLLDLHSGRIVGLAGPWLSDVVALLFIGLALSGLWMWVQTRKRKFAAAR
jgi:hypothetical protein